MDGWTENVPGASFAYSDARTSKVLLQALIVLEKPSELKLRHRLLVRTRAHCGEVIGRDELCEDGRSILQTDGRLVSRRLRAKTEAEQKMDEKTRDENHINQMKRQKELISNTHLGDRV